MENPYDSPASYQDAATPAAKPGAASTSGKVSHVRTIALLMALQGALEILFGLVMIGYTVLFAFIARDPEFAEAMGPSASTSMAAVIVVYGGLSLAAFGPGVLHLAAGIQNYRFRGRKLGLVAMAAGMISVFTCFCAPTTLAIGIWGMMSYLNPYVAAAFEMGDKGTPADEILQHFQ